VPGNCGIFQPLIPNTKSESTKLVSLLTTARVNCRKWSRVRHFTSEVTVHGQWCLQHIRYLHRPGSKKCYSWRNSG